MREEINDISPSTSQCYLLNKSSTQHEPGKMFIFNRQFSLHLQTSKSRTLGKSPFLQKYPISLQAQTSANIKIQLAHSKYLERFRIIFLFFLSPFLVFVNLLLMKFPIPLQAQASANAELSLAHNKYLGRFQIFFFQHTP